MRICIYSPEEIIPLLSRVNRFLGEAYAQPGIELSMSEELLCVAIGFEGQQIIAHGAAYLREMYQLSEPFLAGMIAGVAVAPFYRGKGYSKKILGCLESHLRDARAEQVFICASELHYYQSSGYQLFEPPVLLQEQPSPDWNHLMFNGSIHKPLGVNLLDRQALVEFRGGMY
ncbi:GNAT family N-acetyltransferase [Aliagarivorans marinus]|uniref:GNAT family N-acetyltransferase n=1 Tax=Aliagarivorans marinus TaxID=561965 RepID=UPI0003F6824B|nr:GNAT family N-acetyltransferase [Aliagarivorans marinus]